jgi:apoptosis-inducing factor 3
MADHPIGNADTYLQNGEMKRLELEGKPIVIARVQGNYFAFGGNCSHYGAPLNEGVLKGHTVMCPWHHACFDVRSGTRLEPPALNDLAHYPVQIKDGSVVVTFPHDNVTAPQGKADASDTRTFVVIGGGAAGAAAVEQLRRDGYKGKIILISAVGTVPVDRPNLSKDYLDGHAKPEWMPLRSEGWYAERDIELRLNTFVSQIDPAKHLIYTEGNDPIHYDKLLLATGGVPRRLDVAGNDLAGIFTLRTLADADAIIEAAKAHKRAVIVGASFIGMEVAAALASGHEVNVTMVAPERIPFAHILGEEIGQMLQKAHEANGITFHLADEVTRFIGENGHVRGVELKSGAHLDADFVVIGVGVQPATHFLEDSGLALGEKDRSVKVNAQLQASHADVYAAGDIARWEDGAASTRIEHWRVAQQQGIVAARNMLGAAASIRDHIPFFWTSQWKITVNYVGHATKWDEIIYWGGTPAAKKFIAYFVLGGQLQAAAGCDYDAEFDAIEFIMQHKMPFTVQQMRDPQFDVIQYARGGA